jgi:endonuclease/exonuclease/phosphatase family metal-dependent hydrolase
MTLRPLRVFLTLLALSGCLADPAMAKPSLTVAAWNLEHLAEANNSGCRPRTDADYAALRAYASSLDADVIAFQEVESAAAAARVFDPAMYQIVIENRPGAPNSKPPCNGSPQLHLNRQATGFAVRKDIKIERHPDVTALQDGDPNLRSGVDITVTALGGSPIRLLSVHLKSGCPGGAAGASCETLMRQVRSLSIWVADRGREPTRFAILGDFNRRLALPNDPAWAVLDKPPGPADMTDAAGVRVPRCDPKYDFFIDHIVVDPRVAGGGITFSEKSYGGPRLSDHCAIEARVAR